MKVTLDYNIPEPPLVDGGRFDLDTDIMSYLLDNSKIDRKFNHYLKDKSVIVVGPAAYMVGKEKADFIESFDVVVRLNRGWSVREDLVNDFGRRTDVRWHCGIEHENNGGVWNIEGMKDYGVKWACIPFPRHLSYFHNDILKFEKLNEEHNMNFHCWSDMELYLSIHQYIGTRMGIGTTAFADLFFYDFKRLHISGITFLDGGWYKGYKQKELYDGPDAQYLQSDIWKTHTDVGGHAMLPQRKLLKLMSDMDERITMDTEVKEVIDK